MCLEAELPILIKAVFTGFLLQIRRDVTLWGSVFTPASPQNFFEKLFCFPALDYISMAQHHLPIILRHGRKTQDAFFLGSFVGTCILNLTEA